jgi:hypothetical protein
MASKPIPFHRKRIIGDYQSSTGPTDTSQVPISLCSIHGDHLAQRLSENSSLFRQLNLRTIPLRIHRRCCFVHLWSTQNDEVVDILVPDGRVRRACHALRDNSWKDFSRGDALQPSLARPVLRSPQLSGSSINKRQDDLIMDLISRYESKPPVSGDSAFTGQYQC